MHTHSIRSFRRTWRCRWLPTLMACATSGLAQGAPAASTPTVTLADVFRLVGSQPEIAAAQARARAAGGSRTTARSLANPMLDYRVEQASAARPAPAIEREAMLTATLPLDAFYSWGPRASRAGAEYRAAQSDLAATRQRVLLEAARAYHRVGVAQVGASVSRDLASWLDSLVAYNRARVREGVAAEVDLLRSEVERGRASVNVALMEAELARARADLSQFLPDVVGRPAALVVTVPNRPLSLPAESPTMPVNPELRSARERAAGAASGLTMERLSIIRNVGATIGTKYMGGATALVVGASLPFPLFDQNRGEMARASGERDAAQQDLIAVERRVRGDAAAAQAAAGALTASAAELATPTAGGAPDFLQKADEGRRIALGAYREGAAPLIHLLDAARARGEAHVAFAQLIAAQRDSVFSLLAALGIDLMSTPLSPDSTSR